jgi:hypothetical protein
MPRISAIRTTLSILVAAGHCAIGIEACAQFSVGYNIERIGLTGPEYVGSDGYSLAWASEVDGLILGLSYRLTDVSNFEGGDAWVWKGGQTIPIGLRGPGYLNSDALRVNTLGQVVGYTTFDNTMPYANDVWIWNGQDSVRIGLSGPQYTGTNGYRRSELDFELFVAAPRMIVGSTARIIRESTETGRDYWLWDGTQTVFLGFNGPGYEGSDWSLRTELAFVSSNGFVGGTSRRYSIEQYQRGQDAWVWDGQSVQLIGLIGPGHESANRNRFSYVTGNSQSGSVVGTSAFFFSEIETRTDAWFWNGSTTQRVGPTGAGFDQPRAIITPRLLNERGQIAGTAFDPTAGATIAWVWKDGVTIPLTVAAQDGRPFLYAEPLAQNEDGVVAGIASRRSGLPDNQSVAWVWDGTQTHVVGLTGPGYTSVSGFSYSAAHLVREDGLVFGSSKVLSSRLQGDFGEDFWVWDGITTRRLGPLEPIHVGFEGYRRTALSRWSGRGIIGITYRIFPQTDSEIGDDWWVDEGDGIPHPVGLRGPGYTASDGAQSTYLADSDRVGRIIGNSKRLFLDGTDLGETAFYYDPSTRISIPIELSVRTADGFAFSRLQQLTTDGYAIGTYKFFANGEGEGVARAFAFRPDVGVVHLEELVTGGIAAGGFATLGNAQLSESRSLFVGNGTLNGQPASQGIFVLTRPQGCDDLDFNRNGITPEDADVTAFFDVLAGETCTACNDIDFNNNDVFPEDQDVIDFFRVLAGGSCF